MNARQYAERAALIEAARNAGDRRDWDECNRIEALIEALDARIRATHPDNALPACIELGED